MRIHLFTLLCLVFVLLSPKAESAITSWTNPTIASSADGPGTLSFSESQAVSTTITTFVAVSDATTITYALNPTVSPFALSVKGELTISANLDADTTSTLYTLNIIATDNASPAGSGTATITVTVTDVDETPKFGSSAYKKCILDDSAIDTTVITVLATDSDPGDTITHSIASGDTSNDFKIGATTGVIQVAKALSTTSYTLVVHAVDDENTPKTGSTTVTVTVSADCSEKNSAAINVVSVVSLLICFLAMIF